MHCQSALSSSSNHPLPPAKTSALLHSGKSYGPYWALAPGLPSFKVALPASAERSPGLFRAPALPLLAAGFPHPTLKAAATSTLCKNPQPTLVSTSAFLPKPLGTQKLHRCTPIQGHNFKTGKGNCFT